MDEHQPRNAIAVSGYFVIQNMQSLLPEYLHLFDNPTQHTLLGPSRNIDFLRGTAQSPHMTQPDDQYTFKINA